MCVSLFEKTKKRSIGIMYKKIISVLLILSTLCSLCAVVSADDSGQQAIDTAKLERKAYIHAAKSDPSENPESYTNIYAGEDVNVYAAIDAPNKGKKTADGKFDESEYQYNLNSYIVKFYFDPNYFDLVYHDTKTHENPSLTKGANQSAINYMLPFQTMGMTFEDAEANGIKGWNEGSLNDVIVDYTDRTLQNVTIQDIYGKKYAVVQGVFVIRGENILFPEQDKKDLNWYNLCNITLRPKSSAKGSTEIMVETGMVSNDGVFELIPKHKTGYPYTLKDYTTMLYGGYHQLIIGDTAPINPPVPDKEPGYYSPSEDGAMNVHLSTKTADADIFYSIDETVPSFPDDTKYLPYDDARGIDIPYTTQIKCYARKLVNGSYKYSYVMSYNYFIEPPAPTLFFGDGTKVPYYYYTDNNKFSVFGTDKSDRDGNISNIYEIFYTFSLTAEVSDIDFSGANSNPESGWVKLSKLSREIEIDHSTSVRLVTIRGTSAQDAEYSSVSLYMLYIMPSPVMANPDRNTGYTSPFDVTLTSESTKSGAEILFTTDGSDPRNHGILYTEPITISKNTTIRAVARLDGVYSITTAYNYVFDVMPPLAVSAIPYPGEYVEEADIYLTTGTFDDVIYYTIDGSTPDKNSPVYDRTKPIHLEKDTEIKAVAFSKDGKNSGDVARFKYTIIPDAPIIVPSSTQFNEKSKIITIFKPHTGAEYELYYTTDGSDPRSSSSRKLAAADKADVVISGSTVVNAVIRNSSGHYSAVTTETYEIISGKPARPEVTLKPGVYILENDNPNPFTTSFYAQPEGTKIYYTVGYGASPENPKKGSADTFEFNGEDITLKGNTIIKAIAIDENGKQSDLRVFSYNIAPEAPKIPESTVIADIAGTLLPIKGIAGEKIHYEIGNMKNDVILEGFNTFYVDPVTGKAYRDTDRQTELGAPNPDGANNTSPFELTVYAELDGMKSDETKGTYTYIPSADTVLPPYISVPSGNYDEKAIDENQNGIIDNGENVLLMPEIHCLTDGAEIYYYYADLPDEVHKYSEPLKITDNCIIYMYAQKNGIKSSENLAFYKFIPLSPVIKPVSGMYDNKIDVMIYENPLSPIGANHVIYYNKNSDGKADMLYLGGKITVDRDEIIKAYTIKDYNPLDKTSGTYSKPVYEYYIFSGGNTPGSGKVYVNSPFDTRHTFAVNELSETPCNQGITISTVSDYNIHYKYTVTLMSGETYSVPEAAFNQKTTPPIYPSPMWKNLKITAWLEDDEGNIIPESPEDFNYEFVVLNKPVSTLAETDANGNPILYTSGTQYKLVNEYTNSGRNIKLFYTRDGSDPTDETKRKEFKDGDVFTLTSSETLRAIYMETVDGKSFFGPETKYIYALKTTNGGGGGGGGSSGGGKTTVDNTRKYTKDIFGNEHPTHIGYIYGYPDGSVQPNGEITREEMTAILYRITNHAYEKPFAETGNVFPDVSLGRWSVHDIEYMADKNIVYGYPDGEFKPQNNLTRAEFAALIRRFAKLEKSDKENPFPDLDASHWAYEDILALNASGLMQGYEDGTYRAENEITRAEVMTVVNKILGRNPSEPYVKSLEFNPFNDLEKDKWYYVIVLEATITHNYYLGDKGVEIKWEDCK